MKKKLLFVTDLDGTFLRSDKSMSDFSKKAIKEVEAAGHIFCIATGRAWSQTEHVYKDANINTLVITTNGTLVHSPTGCGFEEVYAPIGKAVANDLINHEWIGPRIVGFSAPSQTDVVHYNQNEKVVEKLIYNGLKVVISGKKEIMNEPASMVLVVKEDFSMDEFSNKITEISDKIQFFKYNIAELPGHYFIGINSNKSKETGIRVLSEHYNIPQENIVSFGDQMNDNTMTKYAGLGCVVQNANPLLKEMADVILDKSNDEDAVAHKMLEIIKGY